MALNFYRYKTFVIFKSDTFEFFFLKIMYSVGNDADANSVFHEDLNIFKVIFGKCSESVNFDSNYDLQEDLKNFQNDTFENHESFVPVEVQSLYVLLNNTHCCKI